MTENHIHVTRDECPVITLDEWCLCARTVQRSILPHNTTLAVETERSEVKPTTFYVMLSVADVRCGDGERRSVQ